MLEHILAHIISLLIEHAFHLGSVVAAIMSYSDHKSPLWAAIHGAFGWFYPLYRWVVK